MHNTEDHCEGTLVVHAVGDIECTESGCVDVEVHHYFFVDCSDIVNGCQCDGPAEVRRAA